MVATIYGLCALTAFLCSVLLFKAYSQSRYKLLLWGGLCFAGLAASNAVLIIDKLVLPLADLSTYRFLLSLISILILLYGLIWDKE